MTIITVVSVSANMTGSYYVDGGMVDTHYHMFQVDSAYEKALSGRTIDQELLEEMKAGYDKISKDVERYSLAEEYQTYAKPYSSIFNFARQSMGITVSEMMEWNADEQDMYEKRQYILEKVWQTFWINVFNGYFFSNIGSYLPFRCFPKEHVRKTDQQILSSKYGRDTVYWAKFLAGISFGFCISLLFVVMIFVITFLLYGGEGFSSAIQLLEPKCSCVCLLRYPLPIVS